MNVWKRSGNRYYSYKFVYNGKILPVHRYYEPPRSARHRRGRTSQPYSTTGRLGRGNSSTASKKLQKLSRRFESSSLPSMLGLQRRKKNNRER
jgi:hypothetical protein